MAQFVHNLAEEALLVSATVTYGSLDWPHFGTIPTPPAIPTAIQSWKNIVTSAQTGSCDSSQ